MQSYIIKKQKTVPGIEIAKIEISKTEERAVKKYRTLRHKEVQKYSK